MLPNELLHAIDRYTVSLPARTSLSPGNQDVVGLSYLVNIGQALGVENAFEIGTYNGLTAFTLARNLPKAKFHTLDLPEGEAPILRLFPGDQGHLDYSPKRCFEGTPEQSRIRQYFGDSATFDFSPFAHSCGLVYVDGAHSFEYVEKDTATALDLVSILQRSFGTTTGALSPTSRNSSTP